MRRKSKVDNISGLDHEGRYSRDYDKDLTFNLLLSSGFGFLNYWDCFVGFRNHLSRSSNVRDLQVPRE